MITISPNPALPMKFGGKQTFTASEGGTWKVQSSNGSVIDNATGVLTAGQPTNPNQQTATDTVSITAINAANGSASVSVPLSK